jgi:peptidoglycan hydrolase CwlO-like protein
VSAIICIHCQDWGCLRCAAPAVVLERTGGEQSLTADEHELAKLRNQVVKLQGELLDAQTAAAVAQREVERLRANLAQNEVELAAVKEALSGLEDDRTKWCDRAHAAEAHAAFLGKGLAS